MATITIKGSPFIPMAYFPNWRNNTHNLPFVHARFCAAEGLTNVVSDIVQEPDYEKVTMSLIF